MKKTILILYDTMYQRDKNITYFEKMYVSLITIGVLAFLLGFGLFTIIYNV